MKSVPIAELKSRLSAYIQLARAGEEILIRDRNLPVAKLVPLGAADTSSEELALAAAGKLALPEEVLDEEKFWSVGRKTRITARSVRAVRQAVSRDREERDARILGR
jgi:prevent-host-death family protein